MKRKSSLLFLFIGVQVLLLAVLFSYGYYQRGADRPVLDETARLVARLGLTDLSLFTEARYTRHLSQADLHSPFQDHPLSLEHFPSGSLVLPPERLRGSDARTLD